MGEQADYIIDQIWNEEEDYDGSLQVKVCKYCNRFGFYWGKTDRGWRLHTATGKIHECTAYEKKVK